MARLPLVSPRCFGPCRAHWLSARLGPSPATRAGRLTSGVIGGPCRDTRRLAMPAACRRVVRWLGGYLQGYGLSLKTLLVLRSSPRPSFSSAWPTRLRWNVRGRDCAALGYRTRACWLGCSADVPGQSRRAFAPHRHGGGYAAAVTRVFVVLGKPIPTYYFLFHPFIRHASAPRQT